MVSCKLVNDKHNLLGLLTSSWHARCADASRDGTQAIFYGKTASAGTCARQLA